MLQVSTFCSVGLVAEMTSRKGFCRVENADVIIFAESFYRTFIASLNAFF